MSKFDYSSIDGHSLQTFIAVLEEGAVTKAAGRIGVSQSAVSHTLDKLRTIFDDPLFIRDGRGITPSARALALREPIEDILNRLHTLSHNGDFDPMRDTLEFTIATNDFPLGLIFPRLRRDLDADGIDARLNFIPAGIPSANLTRTSNCQMLITPAPPNKPDIRHLKLIESKMVCFFDPEVRKAPKTLKEYIACRYVDVRFSATESSQQVLPTSLTSKLSEPAVAVPNFNAVTPFIKGTDLITTQLSVMEHGSLKDLTWAPLPVRTQSRPLFLLWHERYEEDPGHQWMRQRIKETVKSITGT
ncbi:LysR family transcriptional regulator [Haloferula sp.]|uniref:LysR family transcriptional regulator n=1 Tax=Haloferula sp. TaxID=2497595 RepID=UPI00329D8D34